MVMSNLVPVDQFLLTLLKGGTGSGHGIPMPYSKDIFLIETRVAGTTHLNYPDLKAFAANLVPEGLLMMKREQDNPHDSNAILLFTESGMKVGYIPRDENKILARLLDAGKLLFARIDQHFFEGDWLRIKIKVYLKD
jgi:hypothetical protein